MRLIDSALLLITLAPLPVTLMLTIEVAVGLQKRRPTAAQDAMAPSFTVIVPAHNEESGVERTVRSLRADMRHGDRLLVVADNCTDNTAGIAANAGAEVVERHDPTRRGKSYALEYGVAHPSVSATDVTLIVDADCLVTPGSLPSLAAMAQRTGCPVQGDYRLVAPEGAGPTTRFSAFAIRLKNYVRLQGSDRLGIPCVLTGSGMAFPRALLREAALGSGDIVEDLLLSVELALAGRGTVFCPQAQITSPLPIDRGAAERQRARWESGFLSVARRFAGPLIGRGLARRRPDLALMGLDIAIPPLSLLAMILAAIFTMTALAALDGGSVVPVTIAAAQMAAFVISVGMTWHLYGRDLLSPAELMALPLRVIAKIPFYLRLRHARRRGWVRTARDDDPTELHRP